MATVCRSLNWHLAFKWEHENVLALCVLRSQQTQQDFRQDAAGNGASSAAGDHPNGEPGTGETVEWSFALFFTRTSIKTRAQQG